LWLRPFGAAIHCVFSGAGVEVQKEYATGQQVEEGVFSSVCCKLRDLQANGATLGEILKTCTWRSAGCIAYMEQDALEGAAVLEARFQVSEDEDDAHM
jgi:hypothetical protein